jgi:hypothetical protein
MVFGLIRGHELLDHFLQALAIALCLAIGVLAFIPGVCCTSRPCC